MTTFVTSDGVTLTGDLAVPDDVRGAAIVCHPHPQFGGNRFNPVVAALHAALPRRGIASLRFDFRAEFDDGRGEALDAHAALAELRQLVPDVATFAIGYSFGAMIALGLDDGDLAGKALVAPPLFMAGDVAAPRMSTLVLLPSDDQFTPVEPTVELVATWPDHEFHELEGCDHFLHGDGATAAAERIVAWLESRLSR